VLIPFARYSTYQGGKKMELDARAYDVNEFEGGIEYQPVKQRRVGFLLKMWRIKK
jgi:hypothetical protein